MQTCIKAGKFYIFNSVQQKLPTFIADLHLDFFVGINFSINCMGKDTQLDDRVNIITFDISQKNGTTALKG